jgi:HlyD family secretion protein
MSLNKKYVPWAIAAVIAVVGGYLGYQYWQNQKHAVPKGIAWGNGRIEAKQVDATSKESLRVKDVLVEEGDLVQPGQVLVHLDTVTLDSELAEAKAKVASAQERLAIANSAIVRQKSQINLAKIEAERSGKLLQQNAGSQREYDVRKTAVDSQTAALSEEVAKLNTAKSEVAVAESNVATVQTRIDDATLKSPVLGRVLYRLTQPGEVLGPGGKALTLVNMGDIYMEIFLPSEQAARIKVGADARITVDYLPGRAAPGRVTFVSPEAQFTPKQVETRSERDKLMFRVKIGLPEAVIKQFIDHIKTGVRGVGYVKVDESVAWPEWLQNLIAPDTPPSAPASAPAAAPQPGAAGPG